MFDRKRASEYLIVAWVKDWSLRLYLKTISEGEAIDWAEAHKAYPWLPSDATPYIQNLSVRRWASVAMRQINDRLWDAKDNSERLKLGALVGKVDAIGVKLPTNEARDAMRKSKLALAASTAMNNLSIDTMRRGNGSHWAVCK